VPVAAVGPWYRWRGHDDMGSIEEDAAEPLPHERRAGETHVACTGHERYESGRRA
jgi:hypothetical protein